MFHYLSIFLSFFISFITSYHIPVVRNKDGNIRYIINGKPYTVERIIETHSAKWITTEIILFISCSIALCILYRYLSKRSQLRRYKSEDDIV